MARRGGGVSLAEAAVGQRYGSASSFYDGHAEEGSRALRDLMRKISGWRLKHNNFNLTIEQKLFHLYVKWTGQRTVEDVLSASSKSTGVPSSPSAP